MKDKKITEKLKLEIFKGQLFEKEKREIEKSVRKTIKEYGETLKLLSRN